jgi:THO complex subunit 2
VYRLVVCIISFFSSLTSLYSNSLFHSYKQNKNNLLREQSEGFSKLITEVTSALPTSHSPATALPLEPSSIAPEHIQPIWERIVSLIGYYTSTSTQTGPLMSSFSAYLTTH